MRREAAEDTEWMVPIRAQAKMPMTASGRSIGM